MISIQREEGTDYLFAGWFQRELERHMTYFDMTLSVEPKYGEFYVCQDYIPSTKDHAYKYIFYALPSHRNDVYTMMGENCALLSYAADPSFHRQLPCKKIYDVGFIGRRYYPERNKYLEAIQSVWPNSFLNLDTCPGYQIPEKLSQCKVLFNHTRPEIDVNLRFFEELAIGPQVMMRTPSLPEFATEGLHYFGYSTIDECISVIQKLLADEELRKKTAYIARSHFLSHHTYAHRAQTAISCLSDYFTRIKEAYVSTTD